MDNSEYDAFSPDMEAECLRLERSGLLPKKIDRFGDHYLKFLLATPERKTILLDLANTILRLMRYEPLEDIRPIDRELSPDIAEGKGVRLDYLGITSSGRTVNVEFQKRGGQDFIKRSLYNCGTIIHRQLVSGDGYDKISQTIFIGLLDFSLFSDDRRWYWDFVLTNAASGRVLSDDLLLIFIEMNKLLKILKDLRWRIKSGELDVLDPETRLAIWGGYLTNEGVDIVSEVMARDNIFSEVADAEHEFWENRRNRLLQYMEEKRERDAIWREQSAKKYAREEGLAEGRAIGLAEGRAEGRTEGRIEGRDEGRIEGKAEGRVEGRVEGEHKKAVEIAQKLIALGIDTDVVIESSGLPMEEVLPLLDETDSRRQ